MITILYLRPPVRVSIYICVSDTTVVDQQSHPFQVFVSRAGGFTSAFGSDPTFRGY